ncbi:MAG: putative F420-dependent oxidoreductase [Candidatus Poriferisodalaceae bacterium]|jgi:probable F420-dependent oxidoreductase|tara:strand:- start:1549 stop:2439 length:891 start_codon:yes stop_codon:yes gene_type:complete
MKVRFGFTCRGTSDIRLEDFDLLLKDLERFGFDSIWLPETMLGGSFDPLIGLSYAAARTTKLKIGTHLILPGRSPVRLARELAQLDRLSGGRLLLIGVLGLNQGPELLAQNVEKEQRGSLLDELLPLLRRLWTEEIVDHDGPHFRLKEAKIDPKPIQEPLEVWLGGQLPGALRRAGQIGDGYIPGMMTANQAAEKRIQVIEAAENAGRVIDQEHFGANLSYSWRPLPEAVKNNLADRFPGVDPELLIPSSRESLSEMIDAWIEAGYSKFLMRPVIPPDDWSEELENLAEQVLSKQT